MEEDEEEEDEEEGEEDEEKVLWQREVREKGFIIISRENREISAGSTDGVYAVMHRVACAMLRMSWMRWFF